jgi:hypothetical protein
MKLSRSLRAVLLLFFLTVAASALDRNAFSFRNYDLEIRLDPAAEALSARGKITVTNISDVPQSALALQISSTLEWRLVEVDGQPVEYITQSYTTDIDHTGSVHEAVITLKQPLAPGASVQVEAGYSGTIPASSERLTRVGAPKDLAARADWDQISEFFTAVRGVGHVVWYPVSTEAANLSENQLYEAVGDWKRREAQSAMRAEFCWIADIGQEDDPNLQLTVVTNGQLEGIGKRGTEVSDKGESATGCSTHRFTNLGLTAPAFVIDEFQVLTRPTVTVYYQPEHKQYAEAYAAAVEAVQPFLTEWFGPSRENVQVVELDQANVAPEESGSMLMTPLGSGSAAELQGALVHQAAHAAFHSFRPWMYEGLAQFAQAVWRERQHGRQSALDFLGAQLPALTGAEQQACGAEASPGESAAGKNSGQGQSSSSRDTKTGPPASSACQGGRPLTTAYDEVYSRIKAAYVWWMLRDMVGDSPLERAIQAYRPGQDKEPSYFQNLLKAESHQDLEWFFDDWVYRDRGLPDFRVLSVYPRESLGGGYVVTVTVDNLGGAGAEVPVRVIAPEGEKLARIYVAKNSRAVTRIQIATRPTEAVANDGSVPESNQSNNQLKVQGGQGNP